MAVIDFIRYIVKILFSKKQFAVFFVILFSFTSILMFYLFFHTFKKYYIDELKSIYPTVYIASPKSVEKFNLEHAKVSKEIFNTLFDENFKVSFDANREFSVGCIGFRSFDDNHVPKILNKLHENTSNAIYVSNILYAQLKNQKKFNNTVFLRSDINDRIYKFRVVPFELHENTKWILMPNSSAKKLFYSSIFDKVVFYSNIDETQLINKLKKEFKVPVFSWEENISLSNRALKESMMLLFSYLSLAIILIVLISFWFFAQSIVDDLMLLTQNAFFYGARFSMIYVVYIVLLNIYLFSLFCISYLLSYSTNEVLVNILWNVDIAGNFDFLSQYKIKTMTRC